MRKIWLGLFLALLALPAYGQTTMRPCVTTGTNSCPPVSPSNPMPVTPFGGSAVTYTAVSPGQYGVTIASATALTVPATATSAVVCANGANANYTTDGSTTPTASVGMPLLQSACVPLSGATLLANFKAIQQSATATLNVSYFK